MLNRSSIFNICFLILIAVENYTLFFYSINLGQQGLNAFVYFLCGLLPGILLIRRFINKKAHLNLLPKPIPGRWIPLVIMTILILAWFAIQDQQLFQQIPINADQSDVIPTIEILVERLLNKHWVYQPIEDFDYFLPVTYLPVQWMVFVPAGYFGFDYRWIAFGIWVIGMFCIIIRGFRLQNPLFQLLLPLLLLGVYGLILTKRDDILYNTVETMVAGYYLILIVALNQKRAIWLGMAFAICLLSRYSLIIWLPLWAFVMFVSRNRSAMWITIGTTVLLVLLIYVLPFLSKDWNAFMAGYRYYSKAAIGEWTALNLNIMKPFHLNTGTGIAFWFAEQYKDDLAKGLEILQRTHLIACLLTVTGLGIWYWRNKRKIDYRIFLLASFKIYLTVFLFFIQVPYTYLMVVGNFVSIALWAEQLRYVPGPFRKALKVDS